MTDVHNLDSQDRVLARIAFLEDSHRFANEKPYMVVLLSDVNFPATNCTFTSDPWTNVTDLRRDLPLLSLDKHGFIIIPHPLRFSTLTDAVGKPQPPEDLLSYLEETASVVKAQLSAERAICIDWRFRKASPQDSIDGFEESASPRHQYTAPAYKAHSDLSPAGGWMTLRAYLSEEEYAQVESKKRRARVIK